MGLADRAKDRIETYPGMKRRANIAVGLLHEPRLLILDEPTVGVDPQSRNSILEAVAELGGSGMAVLYTTHYMEEAERLCDRIGIIDQGRLIAEGSRDELVQVWGRRPPSVSESPVGARTSRRLASGPQRLPEVNAVNDVESRLSVVTASGPGLIAPAVQFAQAHRLEVTGVDVVQPDLEAVFLNLTGKALRD